MNKQNNLPHYFLRVQSIFTEVKISLLKSFKQTFSESPKKQYDKLFLNGPNKDIKTLKNLKLFLNFKLKIKNSICRANSGSAMIMILVFAGVLIVAVSASLQFVSQQIKSGRGKLAHESALQVAEAGLEYYKWHMAHTPESSWGGSIDYTDPITSEVVGTFTLSATSTVQCGEELYRDVLAHGVAASDDRFTRSISARYMKPSVANYSYMIGSDVWAYANRSIVGPYYSFGGIRMDANHNSTVSSAVSSWSCDSDFNCNPTVTKAGVWGAGSNSNLWQYPQGGITSGALAVDFTSLKTKAQASGRYFANVSGGVGDTGYHIIFQDDGTFDMYQVTAADFNWGWDLPNTAHKDYHTIVSETLLGNYTVPSDCSLIFVDDKLWVEGTVSGKVALAAADTAHPYLADVIVQGDILYEDGPSTDGLTILAQNNILISAHSPVNLTTNGIFVADGGKFYRYHYLENNGDYARYDESGTYIETITITNADAVQDLGTLLLNGTVLSSGRTGTSWADYTVSQNVSGEWILVTESSGFTNRVNSYERQQAVNPPPFTPNISDDFGYVLWREQ